MEGEALRVIDISNSQPFFLSIISNHLIEQLDKPYLNRILEVVGNYTDEYDF